MQSCINLGTWLSFLLLHRALGESKYAGDRDVRYVNCVVPCEFSCQHPEVPGAALWDHQIVKKRKRRHSPYGAKEYRGKFGNWDLLPALKDEYTQELQAALWVALGNLLPWNETSATFKSADKKEDVGGTKYAIPTGQLPWILKVSWWDCEENCRYECMDENKQLRSKKYEQIVQYKGKWPFTRVLGMQELFSSLFSFGNGIPHIRFALRDGFHLPFKGQRDAPMWILYAWIHSNTWIQSTIFHARDMRETEALDYHCATLGLAISASLAIYVNLPIHWSIWLGMAVAILPPLCFWGSHIAYLTFVNFDYGYNMIVAVGLGLGSSIFWTIWYVRKFQEVKSYGWKVMVVGWGVYLVLPLELLDFPPLGGLMDAHALWHMGTIPLSFLMYSFAWDKVNHERQDQVQKKAD